MKKRGWKAICTSIVAASMALSLFGCKNAATETSVEETTAVESSAETTAEVTESTTEEVTEDEGNGLVDGQVIIDKNFDDNKDGSFKTYENGGSVELVAENQQLVAKINSCGKLNYANQVYYDGFALNQGAIYTYSFDVSCDIERSIEYRLQINGGDYHAYTGDIIEIGPEVQHFSFEFDMTEESDPAPRLVFNMGFMDDMTEDPGAHNIYFDNISLVVKSASDAMKIEGLPTPANVTVSQIGYNADAVKTVVTKVEEDETFEVINKDTNESVFTGTFGEYKYADGLGARCKQGDFSSVTDEGTYIIKTSSGEETYEFQIGSGIYTDMQKEVLLMLYRQRCGTATDAAIAGEAFQHDACHTTDAVIYGTEETKDVTGGWHDAGDYGRYVVSGAKTLKDLFLSYTDNNYTTDDIGIPESGNGIPDVLDEARYELDWMLKMQDETTGGVYHKVTCLVFPETVGPEEETDTLYLAPISTAATGDFAAVMAEASVIYKDIDPDFAKTAYDAAIKAWNYIKDLNDTLGFENPDDIVTGEYDDHATMDEQFWAATELKLAGYSDDSIDARINKGLGLDEEGRPVTVNLGWATIGAYPLYDLAIAEDSVLGNDAASWKEAAAALITEKADKNLEIAEEDQYFMSNEKTYSWGSNLTIADNGMLYDMAYNITKDEVYKEYAAKQLDYVLGANPLGYCFVTGFGTVTPENPHHRPSQVAGEAMPGMLVGGADSNLEDPYAKAVLNSLTPALCYVDNVQSYSTNEVTIYWNSPMVYLLSTMQ